MTNETKTARFVEVGCAVIDTRGDAGRFETITETEAADLADYLNAQQQQIEALTTALRDIAGYLNPEVPDDYYENAGDAYLLQAVKVARAALEPSEVH